MDEFLKVINNKHKHTSCANSLQSKYAWSSVTLLFSILIWKSLISDNNLIAGLVQLISHNQVQVND